MTSNPKDVQRSERVLKGRCTIIRKEHESYKVCLFSFFLQKVNFHPFLFARTRVVLFRPLSTEKDWQRTFTAAKRFFFHFFFVLNFTCWLFSATWCYDEVLQAMVHNCSYSGVPIHRSVKDGGFSILSWIYILSRHFFYFRVLSGFQKTERTSTSTFCTLLWPLR